MRFLFCTYHSEIKVPDNNTPMIQLHIVTWDFCSFKHPTVNFGFLEILISYILLGLKSTVQVEAHVSILSKNS